MQVIVREERRKRRGRVEVEPPLGYWSRDWWHRLEQWRDAAWGGGRDERVNQCLKRFHSPEGTCASACAQNTQRCVQKEGRHHLSVCVCAHTHTDAPCGLIWLKGRAREQHSDWLVIPGGGGLEIIGFCWKVSRLKKRRKKKRQKRKSVSDTSQVGPKCWCAQLWSYMMTIKLPNPSLALKVKQKDSEWAAHNVEKSWAVVSLRGHGLDMKPWFTVLVSLVRPGDSDKNNNLWIKPTHGHIGVIKFKLLWFLFGMYTFVHWRIRFTELSPNYMRETHLGFHVTLHTTKTKLVNVPSSLESWLLCILLCQ